MLIGEALNQAADLMEEADLYFGHGTDNAWDEACLLLESVLKFGPNVDNSMAGETLSNGDLQRFTALVDQRIKERVPAAYLVGYSWYGGYRFVVNEDVLVPRSPLAEVIQRNFQPWCITEPNSILDLCTGSGCLGILCAHQFPDAQVMLSDISESALAIARKNVKAHELERQVGLIKSNVFSDIPPQKFDVIVSNPPYVDEYDMAHMPDEFHCEPRLGLASGRDGLDITREILANAEHWLTEQGILVVEIGNSWEAAEQVYANLPFTWLELSSGGHGVFVLTRDELVASRDSLRAAYNRGAKH